GGERRLTGHGVAVWGVLAVHEETRSVERRRATSGGRACSSSTRWHTPRLSPRKSTERVTKRPAQPRLAEENTSHRFVGACMRLRRIFPLFPSHGGKMHPVLPWPIP